MEFKRVNPDCRFTIPDTITVRQQMAFYSTASPIFGTSDYQERLWLGAQELIQDWECSALPDRKIDLDKVTDPQITVIMIWAGNQVRNHLNGLLTVPKN